MAKGMARRNRLSKKTGIPRVKPLARNAMGAPFSPTNPRAVRTIRSAAPLARRQRPIRQARAMTMPILPQVNPNSVVMRLMGVFLV